MSRITADCWKCELPDCGHIWLAASDVPPSHCAKCRRRGWNAVLGGSAIPEVAQSAAKAPEVKQAAKTAILAQGPTDPDGVRRKCRAHKLFYDLCRSKACQQEHQCILDRM
jgi:hypothetical protein